MTESKLRKLRVLMAKEGRESLPFGDYLAEDANVNPYELSDNLEYDGIIYVKKQSNNLPRWADFLNEVSATEVEELGNRSSSAVLLIRTENNQFAFCFGYGRYLLNFAHFQQDFGIRTALNCLDHESLRSVDLHTLDDQPLQKKAQALTSAEISVFGIDIQRDVLRGVTGNPRSGIRYRNISGGAETLSFSVKLVTKRLDTLAEELAGHYAGKEYTKQFSWVDNISRVKEPNKIDELDQRLIDRIFEKGEEVTLTVPSVIDWDLVEGFSYTCSKNKIRPVVDAQDYLAHVDFEVMSVDTIKRHRLYIHDIDGNESSYSIYRCLHFEFKDEGSNDRIIFFSGTWYIVSSDFASQITEALNLIPLSDLQFPPVRSWTENGKKKVESEATYNERAAEELGLHLLDKKLIKSSRTTTPIELCDLLTPERNLVHAKHRKGGSAGLSHLFAQGAVAAQVLIGDRNFRKKARVVLRQVSDEADSLVPLNGLAGEDYQITFLILGADRDNVKQALPFFSQVNLTRAFQDLNQRGFKVSVSGAPLENISDA